MILPEGLMTGLLLQLEELEEVAVFVPWSSSNEILTWGMMMLGGICLCLTSLLFLKWIIEIWTCGFSLKVDISYLVDGLGSTFSTGLKRFSVESYMDVMMMGMLVEEEEVWLVGDWRRLISIELELEERKLGTGMEISLKSLVPPSQ